MAGGTLAPGLPDSYYERLAAGRGRAILSSSRDTEFSYLLSGASNSLFTQHLLAGLRGGIASEDGHRGHRGYVTDLLGVLLEGDEAATAAVYACGPPAMLEAVRELCAERGVACELAMEAPMACGFGACFGCAIPLAGGGYMRLCVDGPVVRGEEIETALVPGSGH